MRRVEIPQTGETNEGRKHYFVGLDDLQRSDDEIKDGRSGEWRRTRTKSRSCHVQILAMMPPCAGWLDGWIKPKSNDTVAWLQLGDIPVLKSGIVMIFFYRIVREIRD